MLCRNLINLGIVKDMNIFELFFFLPILYYVLNKLFGITFIIYYLIVNAH